MAISPVKTNLIGSGLLLNNSWANVGGASSLNKTPGIGSAAGASALSKREAERLDQWKEALSKMNSTLDGQLGKKTDYTPQTANEAAAAGAATHGFFYHDIDALAAAATDGSAKVDSTFAKDTLDFFTGGNYTQSDVDSLQEQMTAALKELGEQAQAGKEVDPSKLTSRITVGGAEMSLKDLADFQMMGQKLTPTFNSINGSSRFDDMQATAKMSVARLTARKFGEMRGEAGNMFANAMDEMYNRGMDRIGQFYADASEKMPQGYAQQAGDVRDQVTQMFSSIRTDNKSLMAYDFNRSVKGYAGLMNQQYRNFGTPTAYRTANAAAQQMGMYFSALSRFMG